MLCYPLALSGGILGLNALFISYWLRYFRAALCLSVCLSVSFCFFFICICLCMFCDIFFCICFFLSVYIALLAFPLLSLSLSLSQHRYIDLYYTLPLSSFYFILFHLSPFSPCLSVSHFLPFFLLLLHGFPFFPSVPSISLCTRVYVEFLLFPLCFLFLPVLTRLFYFPLFTLTPLVIFPLCSITVSVILIDWANILFSFFFLSVFLSFLFLFI